MGQFRVFRLAHQMCIRDSTEEGWWVNLRPSNTEPFLRLNLEAPDVATMERVRDEVLALVRQG